MNKFHVFLFSFFIGLIPISAQQTIDFEYAPPQNSHFIINSKIESIGTMKLTGDKAEMEALKKIGYNQDRKMSYAFDIDVNMKTFKKTAESFPFEFNYEKIKIDVDSDGKKNNQLLSFSDITISGDLRKDKEVITKITTSGNDAKDNFIKSMPREFLRQIISKKNMKVGDQFIVEKAMQSVTDDFKMNGTFAYTLKKIDPEVAYFEIVINLKNDQDSSMALSGNGSGEMVYNHINHYVLSENSTSNIEASKIEKTFKMEVQTLIKSYFSIKLIE